MKTIWPECWKTMKIKVEKYRWKAGRAVSRMDLSELKIPMKNCGKRQRRIHIEPA